MSVIWRCITGSEKVEPLEEALEAQGDLLGQWRAEQPDDHRRSMTWLDPIRDRLSLRPLLDWTPKDVYYYMQENNLPQHPCLSRGIPRLVTGIPAVRTGAISAAVRPASGASSRNVEFTCRRMPSKV